MFGTHWINPYHPRCKQGKSRQLTLPPLGTQMIQVLYLHMPGLSHKATNGWDPPTRSLESFATVNLANTTID